MRLPRTSGEQRSGDDFFKQDLYLLWCFDRAEPAAIKSCWTQNLMLDVKKLSGHDNGSIVRKAIFRRENNEKVHCCIWVLAWRTRSRNGREWVWCGKVQFRWLLLVKINLVWKTLQRVATLHVVGSFQQSAQCNTLRGNAGSRRW